MPDAAPVRAQRPALASVAPPAARRRNPVHVADVALPLAIALWGYGLSKTDVTSLGPLGLPAALPVFFYAGVVLLIVSAVIELAIAEPSQWRLGLHAAVLVVMLYGTAALVYPVGRYAWLYKTIGVVQYVNANGKLNHTIDIYQNWPGFFALAAWFDKVAGVSSPLAYAKWAQVVFELAALPLLYLIYDGLALSFRQRWMALLLYPAANWIGQDYFSPQALGTVLSLAIMALTMRYLFTGNRTPGKRRRRRIKRMLRWLTRQQPPELPPRRKRVSIRQRLAGFPTRVVRTPQNIRAQLLGRRAGANGHGGMPAGFGAPQQARPLADRLSPAGRRTGVLITILLLFFVLSSVHELSPYIVALQLIVLAVARPLRPRWVPLAMLAVAVAYLLPRFTYVNNQYGILGSFGSFFGNAAPPSSSAASYAGGIPASQLLIQHCADALSVLVWLMALVGAWRQRHSGRIVVSLLILTFSPILVLFGQAYGNEGLLRVYLFSLPWAAALAAAAVEPGTFARIVRPRAAAARGGPGPAGPGSQAPGLWARIRQWDDADARRLHRWAAAVVGVRWGSLPDRTGQGIRAFAAGGWKSTWSRMRQWDDADARRLHRWALAVAGVVGSPVRRLHALATRFSASRFMAAVRWVRAPVTLCVIVGLFLVAFYGDDAFDAFSASEVNTMYSFLSTSKPGAVFVAEDNAPGSSTANYYLWTTIVIFGARSGKPVVPTATPEIATVIAGNSLQYTNDGKDPAYVVITPSMTPYNNAYRQAPDDSFAILEKSLAASKQWKLLVNHDGTVIYELPPGTVK